MEKKIKNKTTTIKQTFSYGKSKTVTVEVIKKKDKKSAFPLVKNTELDKSFNQNKKDPRISLTLFLFFSVAKSSMV